MGKDNATDKMAEMLEIALRELYVIHTPDVGLEMGGQRRAAVALANAIRELSNESSPAPVLP